MKNRVFLCTVAPNSHRTAEENLGIGYLASVLRENGFVVGIIDAWLHPITDDEIIEIIEKYEDVLTVGFSCYQTNIERTIKLANKIQKKLHLPIICGGFGPTFDPEHFLDRGIDIVVRGEGEVTMIEVCRWLHSSTPQISSIEGISYREDNKNHHNCDRKLIEDLDSLPFPDRTTMKYSIQRKSTVHILSSRGCMGNCIFCSVIAFFRKSEGCFWRSRTIPNIVDELESLYKQGVRHIKVIDDSFIENERDELWCEKFADEIEKRSIKVFLRGSVRADKITEGKLIHLKRAGFFSFSCGIENGSASALKRMSKAASLKANEDALDLFKKYKFIVQAGFILFDPNTTLSELKENYVFMRKYKWTISKGVFSEMYAAEGTRLTDKLRTDGIVSSDKLICGNNQYVLQDPEALKVYEALKMWHKSHMEIYDMTIDPLTSPKALEMNEIALFYDCAMKLKEIDLNYFGNILDLVCDKRNISIEEIREYTQECIEKQANNISKIEKQVKILYENIGIVYDAQRNPFII